MDSGAKCPHDFELAPASQQVRGENESTPAINELLVQGIEGSEWVVLENSSHLAHVEEPEAYFALVRQFLNKVEMAEVS